MSYYFEQTSTSTTTSNGKTATTTTKTTSGDGHNYITSSSVIVRELTDNEVADMTHLETSEDYEIRDEDRLTKYDFYTLLNSTLPGQNEAGDDDNEDNDDGFFTSDTDSDIEDYWFPSLLRSSVIQFLDDQEQETYMDDDNVDKEVEVEEQEYDSDAHADSDVDAEKRDEDYYHDEDDGQDESYARNSNGKRHRRHHHSRRRCPKRPRRLEEVPIEVVQLLK